MRVGGCLQRASKKWKEEGGVGGDGEKKEIFGGDDSGKFLLIFGRRRVVLQAFCFFSLSLSLSCIVLYGKISRGVICCFLA